MPVDDAQFKLAMSHFASGVTVVTTEQDVAAGVWRAVNDETGQLRFPAGADAVTLAQSRL